MDPKNALTIIERGTVQITPKDELAKKIQTGKPLTIKLGMDPTAPDLHLGHAVVLKKLKEFQDLGHNIVFIIGDATARIGDPTGRSKTRPPLSDTEIKTNTKTYFEQVGKILDPSKITVKYNSEWLDKLNSADLVKLAAKTTLAQITEREDFKNRIAKKESIGLHELFYPLFQGYDSVVLDADVELGGTDQTFNLLFGRHLQEQFGKSPQVILTVPILEGLDGTQKMSKSLGNAIGLAEPADQAYGKLMSISDTLMWRYFKLLLDKESSEISVWQERIAGGTLHPMELKKDMAHEVINTFWSKAEADNAQKQFEALFQKKDYSAAQEKKLPANTNNPVWIVELLKLLGAVTTSSEAKRLIEAGAVSMDEEPIKEFKAEITWKSGMVVKVGKHRIYKLA